MCSDSCWDSMRFHKCPGWHPMGRDEAPETRRRPGFRRRAPLCLLLGLRTLELYRIFLGRSEPYHFGRRSLTRGHLAVVGQGTLLVKILQVLIACTVPIAVLLVARVARLPA